MDSPIDDQLRHDARRFRLRYACEDCAYFAMESGACAEGYPNEMHRARALGLATSLVFCKRFELG